MNFHVLPQTVNFRVPSCTKYNPYDPLPDQFGIMIIGKSGLFPNSVPKTSCKLPQLHKCLTETAPPALGPRCSVWASGQSRNRGYDSSPHRPYLILWIKNVFLLHVLREILYGAIYANMSLAVYQLSSSSDPVKKDIICTLTKMVAK